MATTIKRENPYPKGKGYDVLRGLLAGDTIDFLYAYLRLNLPSVNARVAELRRKGWPINSVRMPHPRLENEHVVVYSMDAHFLEWWSRPGTKHPLDYKPQAGRGKFADAIVQD